MSNYNKTKSPALLILISVFISLPLLESWFAGTLWGLNWKSPALMDQLGGYLRVIKLLLVCFSIYLLIAKSKVISETIKNVIFRRVFTATAFIFALIQIPMLCLGLLFDGVLSSNLSYIHKERNYQDRSIYVYTADPGAMGTAYHYFYLKCHLPLNRYELTQITKTNWMREYSFEVIDDELIIDDKSEEGSVQKIDLSTFKCS